MPSDFDALAQMGPPGSEDIPEMQNLQKALSGMREFQATLKVQSEQNEQILPPSSLQVNTAKKTVTLKDLPIATYEAFNRDRAQLNEIRGAFHQEAERLKAQEQQARNQPPWVQLATALSANLAQAKDMPGWVQAAGRTAAQLNPRPEEIQARRLGILQAEAGLAEKAGRADMEVTRENRLERESAIRQRTEFQKENVNAAIRGEGDPAATTKLAVEMGHVSPEQAEAYQKNLEALKKSYFDKKDSEEKSRMGREINLALAKAGVDEAKQVRLFAQQDKLLATRLAAMEAQTEKKMAAAETKGAAKKSELKDFETKELEQYVAADKALDEVEALLKTPDAKKYMGFASGHLARIGAKYAPTVADPNGVIAGIDSKLKLQTAQAIKSTGAGARGFGPMERPFFEGLAEGITRSSAQNQHIIDTWREYLDQGRKGVLANHTDETLKKYPKMFGPRLAGPAAQSAAPTSNDPLGVR